MMQGIYIVPVNYGFSYTDNKYSFYFHGAKAGRKYELTRKEPTVGFEIDGNYKLLEGEVACEFSAAFQSVVGTGKLHLIEDDDEKRKGLNVIMKQTTQKAEWSYSDEMVKAVAVFRLDVEKMSCKAKNELLHNRTTKEENRMSVVEVINQRHSYRGRYQSTPVPREDLITIMNAGLAAPSGCNKQTTSLIAVDDKDMLEKLYGVINPPVGETAPAIICVLTQRINAYRDRCFAVQDYSAAIENMLLVIVELGYQSCWYEGHITDEDRIGYQMAQILNVPDEYELVCFLPVGVAAETSEGPVKKPFEERAWFNSFRENR